MSVLNRQFPPPIDWQAFERLAFDLFGRIWKDPGTQLHGRAGQPQAGVDVYGENHLGGALTGVQCKGRDGDYNSTLTEAELKAEVEKAKAFQPALQVFILATTAPNDAKLQRLARDITARHRTNGLFDVHVHGWGTLKQLITDFPDLVQKHFGDLAPLDVVARIDGLRGEVRSDIQEIVRSEFLIARSTAQMAGATTSVSIDLPEDLLHARIKDAATLINDGAARVAMRSLQRLRDAEWSTATSRNRCRMLAVLASADMVLGDMASAIAGFRNAYAQAPELPMAKAVLATAQLLDGEQAAAFATASQAMEGDPSSEQATLIVVQAAPTAMGVAALEESLPGPMLTKASILVALSSVAQARGDTVAALRFAEMAHRLDPDGWQACTRVAELLLEPIFSDEALPLTRAVPPDRSGDFERGVRLLRAAWSKIREGDHARNALHVAGNLANALSVGGCEAEAEEVVEQTLAIDDAFAPVLRRQAVTLALRGDWAGVASVLERMPADEKDDQDRIFLGQAKLSLGKINEARQIAGDVLAQASSGRSRQMAAALALEAALASGATAADVASACDAEPDSMLVRAVAMRFRGLDDAMRDRLLADVDRIVGSTADARDRVLGAEILAELGRHSAAADLLAAVTDPAVDTLPLQRRLKALLLADRRKDARTLFESIPGPIRDQKTYLEFGVLIYERVGMLQRARTLLDRHCARNPDDLHSRLAWLGLCERMGDASSVRRWLENVSPAVEGSPQELMAIAHAIDRHCPSVKCLRLGYRALRAGYADPKIHLAYMGGLVFFGNAVKMLRDEPESVDVDTAVTLQETAGQRTLVRIVEGEPEPNIERDEIAPDDPLAIRLSGARVGDAIAIETAGAGSVDFLVKSIRSKFIHAHFRALADFERLFPENRSFGSVPVDLGKGVEGVEPMLRLVRDHGRRTHDLQEQYRAGKAPLAFVAVAGGTSMFDAWDAFVADPEMPIHAAVGSAEEFAMATDRLAGASLAILDPLTIYAAGRLGLVDGLRAAIRLGVTQTARDLLCDLLDDRRRDLDRVRGSMAWTGESYMLYEWSPEQAAALVTWAEAAVAFADTCELVPAEGDQTIVDELRGLWNMLPSACLDSVLAAQKPGAVLVTDDVAFRAMSETSAGVRAVWLQPVLQHGLRAGRFPHASYADAIGNLVDAGYRFTMFGSLELTHALAMVDWRVRGRPSKLFDLLAMPTNDRDTVVGVVEEFARSAWGTSRFDEAFVGLFGAMKRADRKWAEGILFDVLIRMRHRFRWRAWRLSHDGWLGSSSLVPTDVVAARILEPSDRVWATIGSTLKRSFERA